MKDGWLQAPDQLEVRAHSVQCSHVKKLRNRSNFTLQDKSMEGQPALLKRRRKVPRDAALIEWKGLPCWCDGGTSALEGLKELPTVGFSGVSAYLSAIGSQQMAFQSGHRRGQVWDDVKMLDTIIKNARFNLTGKSERDFELLFSERVRANSDRINGKIISQVDKETVVRSVYCFGKKHRPDLTVNEDGIAVEIKYLSGSLDGLKQAIGQSIFYRVRYRFVINLFVVDEKYKDVYQRAANEEEKDLEEILGDLSSDMNIFSYIVPSFSATPNTKACLEWNDIHDA